MFAKVFPYTVRSWRDHQKFIMESSTILQLHYLLFRIRRLGTFATNHLYFFFSSLFISSVTTRCLLLVTLYLSYILCIQMYYIVHYTYINILYMTHERYMPIGILFYLFYFYCFAWINFFFYFTTNTICFLYNQNV